MKTNMHLHSMFQFTELKQTEFGVNIFVAFRVERIQQSKMVWHKYSYTSTSSQGPAIYIVNDCHHYEPVIELEYSTSPSYDIGEVGSIVED